MRKRFRNDIENTQNENENENIESNNFFQPEPSRRTSIDKLMNCTSVLCL